MKFKCLRITTIEMLSFSKLQYHKSHKLLVLIWHRLEFELSCLNVRKWSVHKELINFCLLIWQLATSRWHLGLQHSNLPITHHLTLIPFHAYSTSLYLLETESSWASKTSIYNNVMDVSVIHLASIMDQIQMQLS